MRRWTRNVVVLTAVVGCLLTGTAWAASDTYGWIEKTRVEPVGAEVKAKLDSGALTSSLHAEDIERFERNDEGWVRFTLALEDMDSGETVSERIELPIHRSLTVRGAGGKESRPVVLMRICMDEMIYEEQFSLRDRSEMLYPVLLGRRTIKHLGTLDVTKTFQHEPRCDANSPAKTFDERETDEGIDD